MAKKPPKQIRIDTERERLSLLFTSIPDKKRQLVDGLIHRAAYMRITLEDYEKDLDEFGYVESFTQSEKTEPYERERPVARLYNTMNKNYQSIIKQLTELLPQESAKSDDDDFDRFVSERDD
jgi:hypothetical protein